MSVCVRIPHDPKCARGPGGARVDGAGGGGDNDGGGGGDASRNQRDVDAPSGRACPSIAGNDRAAMMMRGRALGEERDGGLTMWEERGRARCPVPSRAPRQYLI